MTVAHSVAEVLAEHVELEVECIDRMYLNEYVPQLQYDKGVVAFFRFHRGHTFASSALMKPISDRFVAQLKRFAAEQEVPLIRFEKGQRKDDVARAYLAGFGSQEGVLFIGKAQEKTRAFRTEGRRHRVSRERYAWIVPSTAIARHAGCDPGRRHELSSVRTQRETARARRSADVPGPRLNLATRETMCLSQAPARWRKALQRSATATLITTGDAAASCRSSRASENPAIIQRRSARWAARRGGRLEMGKP